MVRTYLINKNKFAKKCSDKKVESEKTAVKLLSKIGKPVKNNNEQIQEKRRYYAEKKSVSEGGTGELTNFMVEVQEQTSINKTNLKNFVGLQSRPKLGTLPAFIPFGDL